MVFGGIRSGKHGFYHSIQGVKGGMGSHNLVDHPGKYPKLFGIRSLLPVCESCHGDY